MLAAMGLDSEPAARQPPKRAAASAEVAEPGRRSSRNAGKQVFYGHTPHQTPISALITASMTTLGQRAAHGLPWPTLAQLVRPSLEEAEDPRIENLFPSVRTSVQNLLKAGKLRRAVVSLREEQQQSLGLKLGDVQRTRTALRVLVLRAIQVQPYHMGEWDVLLKDEPTEEEARATVEAASAKATQRVLALEQRLREGAEDSMDVLTSMLNTELDIQRKLADAQQAAIAQAQAPPTPWIPAADVLPELQRDGDAVAENDSDDEWQEEKREDPALDIDATPGCRVELMCSMGAIKSRLRRSAETDASFFSLPPGWTRVPDESRSGRRRTQMVYTRLPEADSAEDMAEDHAEEEDMELNRHTMTKVIRLMRELKSAECAWPFLDPVELDDTPGYADVIATPMDLSTVQSKLDSGAHYFTLNALAADLRLIATNCIRFNSGVAGAEEYIQTALAFERQVERQLAVVRGADEDAGVVRHRHDLEDILEKHWNKDEHGPWLGQVVNGRWEIRSTCSASRP